MINLALYFEGVRVMALTKEQLMAVCISELDLRSMGKISKADRDMQLKEALVRLKMELLNDNKEDVEIQPEVTMQIKCVELLMTIQESDWQEIPAFIDAL